MPTHRRPAQFLLPLLVLVLTTTASAEPFWVAYEGNDYPEDVGWTRQWGDADGPYHGGAFRTLNDGVFTSYALHDPWVFDFQYQNPEIVLGPDEQFVATWRALVDPASDAMDTTIVFTRSDTPGDVSLFLGPEYLTILPGGTEIPTSAGDFHTYTFRSYDMLSYELEIDGATLHTGIFELNSLLSSYVAFGDGAQPLRSRTEWDYFRYGVVPEPNLTLSVLVLLFTWRFRYPAPAHTGG